MDRQEELFAFLKEEGVSSDLLAQVRQFRAAYPSGEEWEYRIANPASFYYGKDVWEKALAVLLAGENLLLSGPKATGKNVLAENLSALFGRPSWDISFHINMDASFLIGTDTFDGQKVVFRPGPVSLAAENGGFAVLDEINMAKNEALAVLHATLDFRRVIDMPGYKKIVVHPATRFIGTMNYGYAGTRDLNEALCSRFAVLSMPLIREEDLTKLISRRFSDIRPEFALQFARLFYDLQKKAEHGDISERALDLRGLLDAIALVHTGLLTGQALEMCVTNKTFDAYERRLVSDVIAARLPQDLRSAEVFQL